MRDTEAVNAQFAEWLERKARDGLAFNATLLAKRDFSNPSLPAKLLQFAGLSEASGTHLQSFDMKSDVLRFDYQRISDDQRRAYDGDRNRKRH